MPIFLQYAVSQLMLEIKRVYGGIIELGKESYQVARSVLPMSYHHPFVFYQNLMSLIGQARRRMCFGEEEFICGIYWKIRNIFIEKGLELIADIMRPACDRAKKLFYAKSDGSELFSNLFAGCGRWPSNSDYSEFNKSCTDRETLMSTPVGYIPLLGEYKNFDEDSYDRLGVVDRELFEEN